MMNDRGDEDCIETPSNCRLTWRNSGKLKIKIKPKFQLNSNLIKIFPKYDPITFAFFSHIDRYPFIRCDSCLTAAVICVSKYAVP